MPRISTTCSISEGCTNASGEDEDGGGMAGGEGANRFNAKDCVVICRNLKSILETMGSIGVSVQD